MTEPTAGKSERGVRYPGDNLEVALEMLARVKQAIGLGAASRETVAEALGYGGISGTSARKIGALTHFALLDRIGGGSYQISDLGRQVLMPTSAEDRAEAIADAASRPSLYTALIGKYADHALPSMLSNLLAREFGVAASSSEAAAKTFRETMEFAGLLRNGVLRSKLDNPPSAGPGVTLPMINTATTGTAQSNPSSAPSSGTQDYTIPLDASGRLATLRIPLPLSTRDLRRVRSWVDFMVREVEEEPPDTSGN